jgi:hypothetical protein
MAVLDEPLTQIRDGANDRRRGTDDQSVSV